MIAKSEMQEMNCMHLSNHIPGEKHVLSAFMKESDFRDNHEKLPRYVLLKKAEKCIILEVKEMPRWLYPGCKGCMRVHRDALTHLMIQSGDKVEVHFIDHLPPLKHVFIDVGGYTGCKDEIVVNAVKQYLLGKPVHETSNIPVSIGFTHMHVTIQKAFPFSQGVVSEQTKIHLHQ